jgi:hypothetical protein
MMIKHGIEGRIKNEKGIALVTVLILSLIALAIMSTLLYFVLQGTKMSGFFKRYETAREAGMGGAEIAGALINSRGKLVVTGVINYPKACDCGDPDVAGDNMMQNADGTLSALSGIYACLCPKLCDPTANWRISASCDNSLTITSNPDLQISLAGIGTTPGYTVFAKIVDTTSGYTDMSGGQLGGTGVVSSSSQTLRAPPQPFMYRLEVNAQSTLNPLERSNISVLYAY